VSRPDTSFRAPRDSRRRQHRYRQRTRRRRILCLLPPDPMTTAAQGNPSPALPLGPVLGTLPAHLVHTEVPGRLGPTALASLAGAGRGCAAAVAATALMRWAKFAKRAYPGHVLFNLTSGRIVHLPPLSSKEACSYAARGGNWEVLEWLHNTGCPWDATTTCAAAAGGHLEVLKWLHNHGCPWNYMTCAYAAEGGQLTVLQWLREHGCPWDRSTCIHAAMAGQLEVLQWVRDDDANGEAWSEHLVRRIRYTNGPRTQEVLTWLDGLTDI